MAKVSAGKRDDAEQGAQPGRKLAMIETAAELELILAFRAASPTVRENLLAVLALLDVTARRQ